MSSPFSSSLEVGEPDGEQIEYSDDDVPLDTSLVLVHRKTP